MALLISGCGSGSPENQSSTAISLKDKNSACERHETYIFGDPVKRARAAIKEGDLKPIAWLSEKALGYVVLLNDSDKDYESHYSNMNGDDIHEFNFAWVDCPFVSDRMKDFAEKYNHEIVTFLRIKSR
jgi:hypothetical protein